MDILLTIEDVAKRWELKPATLDNWRWTGRGPRFLKVGDKIWYRPKDIESFEEQRTFQNTVYRNYAKTLKQEGK